MAHTSARNTPTSVILTEAQKAFIKRVAKKEERTFSHQLRFIVTQWCDFHSKKESANGKESKEGQKDA